ncbi:MAG: GntR family transcriptional regulator [Bacteroidales bacterium]|nr:GntR family transcriptional regulator [Bacteroidales bacterium]
MTRKLLYVDIAEKIRSDILDGTYPLHSLLPTEREFEEIFDVSKITIRKAIEILSDQGYVQKKSGVGTTVISNRLFNKLSKVVSFSSLLEEEHKLDKKLLDLRIVELDKVINPDLYMYFGKKALKLERMYYLDDAPYIYFEHYFNVVPIDLDEAINEIEEKSIYKWLADHNFNVASFRDEFEIRKFESVTKEILNCSEEMGLSRIRKSKDASGKTIEVSIGNYNTQMKPYIIEYEI